MKYENQIEIDLPRQQLVKLFSNPEYYPRWQKGLTLYETIKGEQGMPGAHSRLKFKTGKREMNMVETIIENHLPDKYTVTYETSSVHNLQSSMFKELSPGKTLYHTYNEFKFSGFMKIFGWLMPGAFKKQTQKYLEQFKAFAEEESHLHSTQAPT
ncbi:SRPBCC family protein [Porifericola rhodea]|uniref:SRPBCC family protein n=1 Tax=Porifericola rhodea TaxID=930972 RepID=UPI0026670758|nr:SRPBCC family protein [Porifericola rhodea]WKN31429.1 SRPBCC family protein [Porifericola rhodea]